MKYLLLAAFSITNIVLDAAQMEKPKPKHQSTILSYEFDSKENVLGYAYPDFNPTHIICELQADRVASRAKIVTCITQPDGEKIFASCLGKKQYALSLSSQASFQQLQQPSNTQEKELTKQQKIVLERLAWGLKRQDPRELMTHIGFLHHFTFGTMQAPRESLTQWSDKFVDE